MPYQATINRLNPTCLLFLVDQSQSMCEPVPGELGVSKARMLADVVNDLIHTIVRRCLKEKGEPPFHYFDIGLIGYASQAVSLIPGQTLVSVHDIANRGRMVDDERGRRPVWFEPVAEGTTAMCAALNMAGHVAHGWATSHQHSFPPLVFNITDGMATDGDPIPWADQLRGISTADGQLLLFNVNISSHGGPPISFPCVDDDLPTPFAKTLFRMSSPLPAVMRPFAAEQGHLVVEGSRGFVYNADMAAIVSALDIGTRAIPGV